MKTIFSTIRTMFKDDKAVLFCLIGFMVAALTLAIVVAFSINPSTLPVWIRYASFGENYYSDKWYYTYSFLVSSLILFLLNSLFVIKLYKKRGRAVSLIFLSLSALLIVITFIVLMRLVGINKS